MPASATTRSAGRVCATRRVQLDASEAGGEARIGLEQGVVELPGVFDEPALPFDRLDAKLDWKIERRPGAAPNITVRVREASFANADAEGELSATWRTGSGEGMARGGRFPGVLELDGRIGNARAVRTVRYLPLGTPGFGAQLRQPRGARRHDRAGVVPGPRRPLGLSLPRRQVGPRRASSGSRPRSPASSSPTSRARRRRRGRPKPATRLAVAHRRFRRADHRQDALEIRNARARLGGADWTGVRGAIPQLGDHARFEIEGMARGPLADMLRYVNATPVGRWTGRRARQRQRQRQSRPQARARRPARRSGRDQGQGQPRAGRQRRAHDARHAAARRRQGADRFHPERVHRRRRQRARARRRHELRRRFAGRQPALHGPGHGHRRGAAQCRRARSGRAACLSAGRPATARRSPSSAASRSSA